MDPQQPPRPCPFCPFCTLAPGRVIAGNAHGVFVRDSFPVSPGHTLVIPVRHFGSLFDATPDERAALLELLEQARTDVLRQHTPDGWNIGINDGPAAGQTVPHLHIHLIPRYRGDREDPRGGVRWVLPDQAAYWNRE